MKPSNFKSLLFSVILSVMAIGIAAQTKNPILPGFYPDPSICRVDNDYYLVNSSFALFPGVPIFHSTDLSNWKQIGHILDRPSQLNLTYQRISGGIYAPSIRFHEGTYYMITTLVGGEGGNFYVTAKDPAGPWSDPNWLRGIEGIDPSFFFDNDGKAYIINNGPVGDGNPLYEGHRSLWLQEFDLASQKPIGPRIEVVNGGTDLAKKPIWIEGPHLFHNKGYYYLLAAEGGTGIDHSEVIFRSKSIWGPYESYDGNPILTQRDMSVSRPNPVTNTGHADFVQTPEGDWITVYLACQPYVGESFNTGRQTFIQEVDWSGEWPIILERGKAVPEEPVLPVQQDTGKISFSEYSSNWKDDFDLPDLKMEWNFIRTPKEKWFDISGGKLHMNARPISIDEVGNPSFIGRRLQHKNAEFISIVSIQENKNVEAGIVAFQNEEYFYKMVIKQENNNVYLVVSSASKEYEKFILVDYIPGMLVHLRMQVSESTFICSYSFDGEEWTDTGEELDGKHLSTKSAGGFIGAYFGLYTYAKAPAKASFESAVYRTIERINIINL